MLKKLMNGLLLIALAAGPLFTQAQNCKGFLKSKCLPNMAPFTHNGQMNTASLAPGQSIKVEVTFYSGQNYRILTCGQENLGNLQFKLIDEEKSVIYDSADESFVQNKDFNVATTIKLTIEVTAPKADKNTGCVSVLIGFQDAERRSAGGRAGY